MPSSSVFDPTNYTALIPAGTPRWHDGSGSVTYSFLTEIPAHYDNPAAGDNDGSVIAGQTYAEGTNPSLTLTQRAMAELAIERYNEVANINLVPAGTSGSGGSPTTGSPITGNGSLVGGLGGPAGFGETVLSRNDDGSSTVDVSAVFENGLNFFGNTYSSIFVNTNGNITFGSGLSTYTPFGISGSGIPIIAPFFGDVDTRSPALAGAESAPIYVDVNPTGDIVTITWDNVNFFRQDGTLQNSFQLQLFDRGGGDFDIVFRYEEINWTTGDASGGTDGLGGSIARAGFSAGDGLNFYELAASGNQAAILNLENAAGNTGTSGLWAFEVRNGGTGLGDVTFGAISTGDLGLYGFAYYPTTSDPIGGDVWLNNSNGIVATPTFYDEGWDTFIHELGHALGLEHPFDGTTLPANLDNSLYTVMSYDPIPTQAGVPDPTQQFPATPMLYDIQALQVLYGANMSTRTGDDVYFASGGVSGFEIPNGGSLIATIWDAGGIDTFDASEQTSAVRIDLRPGFASTIGSIANNILIALGAPGTRAMSAVIENAVGGSANDVLIGNTSNNVLRGNAGADQMNGFGGSDTASYEGSAGVRVNLTNGLGSFGHAQGDILTAIENVTGSGFADTLLGNSGANILRGEGGFDVIHGYAGNDRIYGGGGADKLYGEFNADVLFGGDSNDILSGGEGADTVYGEAGGDTFIGDADAANDTYVGGTGLDTIDYGAVATAINVNLVLNFASGAAIGIDRLFGIERVLAGNGNDRLSAGADTALLAGGGGNDNIVGGGGDNNLYGGDGNDNIRGFAGFDRIFGGNGNDRMQGDFNADIFVFENNFGRDIIADFEATNPAEKIDLSAVTAITSFADLAANHLTQVGGNAVITDGFNTITLNGVAVAALDAGDFVF